MDLAEKIKKVIDASGEQINQVKYGEIKIKVANGNDVDVELNVKLKPLKIQR